MRCLFHLVACLPLSALSTLGAMAGRLLWWMNGRARQVTEINLSLCLPELNVVERQHLARYSLVATARTAFEAAAIWLWPIERVKQLVKRVAGENHFRERLAESRGIILLTPHLGNWEMVGVYVSAFRKLTVLYTPAKLPAMEQIMVTGRTRCGYNLAPANAAGVKALLRALKAGEMIGILPDQVPESESGEFVPFFGQPALTMTLIATLARRTGAQVVCAYAKRLEGDAGFEICFRPVTGNVAAEDIAEALTALNHSIETCVRDCPEQYQWEYKRFRKQPPGLPKPY